MQSVLRYGEKPIEFQLETDGEFYYLASEVGYFALAVHFGLYLICVIRILASLIVVVLILIAFKRYFLTCAFLLLVIW